MSCPMCESENSTYLGILGTKEYTRCRDCGVAYESYDFDESADDYPE